MQVSAKLGVKSERDAVVQCAPLVLTVGTDTVDEDEGEGEEEGKKDEDEEEALVEDVVVEEVEEEDKDEPAKYAGADMVELLVSRASSQLTTICLSEMRSLDSGVLAM